MHWRVAGGRVALLGAGLQQRACGAARRDGREAAGCQRFQPRTSNTWEKVSARQAAFTVSRHSGWPCCTRSSTCTSRVHTSCCCGARCRGRLGGRPLLAAAAAPPCTSWASGMLTALPAAQQVLKRPMWAAGRRERECQTRKPANGQRHGTAAVDCDAQACPRLRKLPAAPLAALTSLCGDPARLQAQQPPRRWELLVGMNAACRAPQAATNQPLLCVAGRQARRAWQRHRALHRAFNAASICVPTPLPLWPLHGQKQARIEEREGLRGGGGAAHSLAVKSNGALPSVPAHSFRLHNFLLFLRTSLACQKLTPSCSCGWPGPPGGCCSPAWGRGGGRAVPG